MLLAAEKGLDAGIVYPSGIIGPGDRGMGSMTVMLRSFLRGRLPAGVCGGYDFVDVRDAAAGAVSCADSRRPGEGYILSGRYASIKDLLTLAGRLSGRRAPGLFLPRRLAGLAAPIFERRSIRRGEKPFFTPYSISVLGSNGNFSHKKASDELGYSPRGPVRYAIGYPALAILAAYIKRAASAAQRYHISPLAMASHSLSGHTMGVAASCGS